MINWIFKMTIDINSLDLEEDFEVLIYGHEHTLENLNEQEEVLDSLMDDSDYFALEHLGYKPEYVEGHTIRDFDSTGYPNKMMKLAGDHFDQIWGPDSKSGLPYYTLGILLPLTVIYGIAARRGYESIKDMESFRDSFNTFLEPEEEDEKCLMSSLTRREILAGTGAIAGMYSVGFFNSYQTDSFETRLDKQEFPFSANFSDIREVYIAESISRIADVEEGRLLGIFGVDHSDSIVNYLEDSEARSYKLDIYEEVIPESQQKMTRWVQDEEDSWLLEEVSSLS